MPTINKWIDIAPKYCTLTEACISALKGEIENVALYDILLISTNKKFILAIYTALRKASMEKHTPALKSYLKSIIDNHFLESRSFTYMKSEIELEHAILVILKRIHKDFPELIKYINEMPVNIRMSYSNCITKRELETYNNSLSDIYKEYSITHSALKGNIM